MLQFKKGLGTVAMDEGGQRTVKRDKSIMVHAKTGPSYGAYGKIHSSPFNNDQARSSFRQ